MLLLTRKTPFLCFFFSGISYTFSHFCSHKLFICIHLTFFMHTIQNNTFCQVPISPIESQASTLCWWNTIPLGLKLFQENARINCKTSVSTKRWNSCVEFHEKNDQPRKNWGKLTNWQIVLEQNFISFSKVKLVSLYLFREYKQFLFHAELVLDLLFLFKQFQSHYVCKVFPHTKIKV